jgi:hypothetical protein
MSKGAEAYTLLSAEMQRTCPQATAEPGMIAAMSAVRDVADRHDVGISRESFVAGFLLGGAVLVGIFALSERRR